VGKETTADGKITKMKTDIKTAFHSGDLGDLILALPICREIGLVRMYVGSRPFTKEFTEDRYLAIKGLLEAQPYIESVILGEPGPVDYDFSTFRSGGMPWGKNIMDIQSDWVLKKTLEYKPWLTAGVDSASKGRVIVHRSPRYRNPSFSWSSVVRKLGGRALSICFPGEHKEMEDACGSKIERLQLRDYLHLAELLNGCDFFVGNQSSPLAVATGLGCKTIQETCLWIPDCIYKGAPIQYVHNGSCMIDGELIKSPTREEIQTNTTPPGGWIVKCPWSGLVHRGINFYMVTKSLMKSANLAKDAAEALIVSENTDRVMNEFPTFMGNGAGSPGRLKKHLQSIGITDIV